MQHRPRAALTTRVRRKLPAFSVLSAAVVCGLLFVAGRGTVTLVLVAGAVAFALLARWPAVGFYTVVAGALAIDIYDVGHLGLASAAIPFWSAFDTFSGIPLRCFPAELLMITSFSLLVIRRADRGIRPVVPFGRLFGPCLVLMIALGYGLLRGMTHQDLQLARPFNLPAAVAETRGFAYLPLMYALGHTVIDSPRQVRTFIWVVIAAVGFAALQASWVTAQLGASVFSLNEIAAHETSVYWSALILLTAALWLYRASARQRWAALVLVPPALVGLVANQRRSVYVALAIALLIGWALVLTDRRLRSPVLWASTVLGVLIAMYAAVAWQAPESPLSAPVYAFRSISEPDPQDFWSNKWREIENVDIAYTIRRSPLLGLGFGQQYFLWIDLPSLEVYAANFVYWSYITHNAIYWVWIKLGAVGFVVFWHLICSALIVGCLAFRRHDDGELKAAALLGVSFIAMLVVFSYADLSLTSPKNMACLGALMGLLASLDRLASASSGRHRSAIAKVG